MKSLGNVRVFLIIVLANTLTNTLANTIPAHGRVSKTSEERDIKRREYPLKDDEVWPEDVAQIFDLKEEAEEAEEEKKKEDVKEEEEETGDFNGRRKRRSIRGEEWTGVWPQRWSESGNATLRHPAPKDNAFIYYYRPEDDTYVMSRCTSTVGAAVLILACPQPRGYKFHRLIDLKKVYYGWSMTEATCQYIEGDCTLPYEFMHKQIMRPSKPISQEDFFSVGPTFFCNRWDGGGREEWVFDGKMTCSIGARRASASLNPLDTQSNPYGSRFGYAWERCGTATDWFDFIQAEYKCVDVMEPLTGPAETPEKFFGCDQRSKKAVKDKKEEKKGEEGKS